MLMSVVQARKIASHRAAPGHAGLTKQDFAKVSLIELASAVNAALGRSPGSTPATGGSKPLRGPKRHSFAGHRPAAITRVAAERAGDHNCRHRFARMLMGLGRQL